MGQSGAFLAACAVFNCIAASRRAFRLRERKRVGYTFGFAIRPRDLLGERKEFQAKLA
jgi:hypothetical protein